MAGKDRIEHDDRLHKVLTKFREAGLTLNDKCKFAMTEIKFLGHVVNAQGIRADPDKIKAIRDMPEPKNVSDICRFMGMVNFVGKFSPRLSELTKPLRHLEKSDTRWTWEEPQRKAFMDVKKELSSDCWLSIVQHGRQWCQQMLPPTGWGEY